MSESGSGVYRVELAKQGRAVCSATHCKKEGVKIPKGDLRQGVLVQFKEHTSMKWRHWGCVTPAVLHNWKEVCQMDMELVDGYDILPEELQEKVKLAFKLEHVDDEDWNGDVEMNRYNPSAPRQGMFVKTPKKKKDWSDEDDDDDDFDEETPIKKKASKKRGRVEQDEDDADEPSKPAAKKSKAKAKAAANEDIDEAAAPPPKPKGRGKKAKAELEDADAEPGPAKKSRSKKSKPADDIVSSQTFVADDEPAPAKKSRSKKAVPEEAAADVQDNASKPKKRRGRPKKAVAEYD